MIDIWCVAAAVVVAAVSYGLGWLGGHAVGRYKGEKGRRLAAEAYMVMGAPQAKPARRVTMRNAPMLEPKMAPQGFDRATLERGAAEIMANAKDAGAPISEDQAMVMAEDMLTRALFGGGVEDDIALG